MAAGEYRMPPPLRRAAAAFIEALGPAEGGRPVAPTPAVLDRIERHLASLTGPARLGIVLALGFVEIAPALLGFGIRRMSALPIEARRRYLARWERIRSHRLHLVYHLARAVAMLSIYSQPEVQRSIGYDPEAYLAGLEEAR